MSTHFETFFFFTCSSISLGGSTTCGFSARCSFPSAVAGGKSILYLGTTRVSGGISLFPGTTRVRLSNFIFLLSTATIGSFNATPTTFDGIGGAVSQHPLAARVPAAASGFVAHFQALGVKGSTVMVTNVATTRF